MIFTFFLLFSRFFPLPTLIRYSTELNYFFAAPIQNSAAIIYFSNVPFQNPAAIIYFFAALIQNTPASFYSFPLPFQTSPITVLFFPVQSFSIAAAFQISMAVIYFLPAVV
jgi:hypothetical protein